MTILTYHMYDRWTKLKKIQSSIYIQNIFIFWFDCMCIHYVYGRYFEWHDKSLYTDKKEKFSLNFICCVSVRGNECRIFFKILTSTIIQQTIWHKFYLQTRASKIWERKFDIALERQSFCVVNRREKDGQIVFEWHFILGKCCCDIKIVLFSHLTTYMMVLKDVNSDELDQRDDDIHPYHSQIYQRHKQKKTFQK